jgi:hypothetical protein
VVTVGHSPIYFTGKMGRSREIKEIGVSEMESALQVPGVVILVVIIIVSKTLLQNRRRFLGPRQTDSLKTLQAGSGSSRAGNVCSPAPRQTVMGHSSLYNLPQTAWCSAQWGPSQVRLDLPREKFLVKQMNSTYIAHEIKKLYK